MPKYTNPNIKLLTYTEPQKRNNCINCKGKITNKNYKCHSCESIFCLKCRKLMYCKICKGMITEENKQERSFQRFIDGDD